MIAKELKRLAAAGRASLQGLCAGIKHEVPFRHECILALILMPLSFYLGSNMAEKLLLLSTVFLVLITEILNSAIEAVVDRISPEHHTLSGRAKDYGSLAVFLSMMYFLAVWISLLVVNYLH